MATVGTGGSRLPVPVSRDGGWAVLGGTANRLWDRGCFGRPIRDGILLTAAEVLNAHRLRGLPLPYDGWLSDALESSPNLLFEVEVLGALRVQGVKVVLAENLTAANAVLMDERSWALRWPRDVRPTDGNPVAEIRWMRARDPIDWQALSHWTREIEAGGRIAEILIVDDEHGVVTYRCAHHDPRGEMPNPFRELENEERRTLARAWAGGQETEGGHWLDIKRGLWPVKGAGIALEGGVWIDEIESRIVSRIINPTMPNPGGERGVNMLILEDLLSRGLVVRTGFKYGTRWRAYERSIGEGHAPWLVSPLAEAPTDWGEVLLSVRLGSGVKKHWICALQPNASSIPSDVRPGSLDWKFLGIERPPSDSRWSNPVRH
ncbi:MAG: hypothetical protein QGF94_01220 [Candidatus Thalassarchaeaceae archaeon]|nr:hypothetical protein [Candidatus Thalassarchaeaceae archaeon]